MTFIFEPFFEGKERGRAEVEDMEKKKNMKMKTDNQIPGEEPYSIYSLEESWNSVNESVSPWKYPETVRSLR